MCKWKTPVRARLWPVTCCLGLREGEGACLSEGGRGGGECSRYHACIRFLPSENFALDNSPCLQFKAAGFKAEESQQVRERNGEMKVVCA